MIGNALRAFGGQKNTDFYGLFDFVFYLGNSEVEKFDKTATSADNERASNRLYFPAAKSVKMNPTKEQKAIVRSVVNGESLRVDACAGSGKEQSVDCVVQAPNGPVRIGDLKIGDEIFGLDGSIQEVSGVFPQGWKRSYKVTFRDGATTRCGIDHLWAVNNKGRRGDKTRVMSLAEIIESGVRRPDGRFKHRIPLCEPVDYPWADLKIDPYLLGLLISDGSLSGSTPALSFNASDQGVINEYLGVASGVFKPKIRNTGGLGLQTSLVPVGKDYPNAENWLKTEIIRLGLNKRSHEKHIPEEYLRSSIDQRMRLLQGLMDGDGSCSRNRTSYSTVSPMIRSGIVELVQSLGGTAIVGKDDERGNHNCFNINVKLNTCPFLASDKRHSWSESWKNPPSRYIKDVQFEDYKDQVCISVSSDDCLYLTDSFIATHNTTTAVMIAEAVKKPVLYLAYNKALSIEGGKKFKESATVRTTHSLAYRGLNIANSSYLEKLSRPRDQNPEYALTYTDVVNRYRPEPIGSYFDRYDVAKMAKEAVKRFQYSGDKAIQECHCYVKTNSFSACLARARKISSQNYRETDSDFADRMAVIARELVDNSIAPTFEVAKKLWVEMIDPDSLCKIDHDTYLKMFQLSLRGVAGPWVDLGDKKSGYGLVILDEAQDTNACVLDIVNRMRTQTVAVGDKRQALYGWRGAENAMEKLEYPALRLSRSWRFGESVAKLATDILRSDGYEWDILGNPNVETVIGDIGDEHTKTFLSRTNAGVIEQAIDYIDSGEVVCMEIDASRVGRMIKDCVAIKNGEGHTVKTTELKPYSKDWSIVEELAESDIDLRKVVKLVNDSERKEALRIGGLLEDYRKPTAAKYTFCTGHKSKGLEWDNVVLGDDYPAIGEYGLASEDINLLYVSVTRAKTMLQLNDLAKEFTDSVKKKAVGV